MLRLIDLNCRRVVAWPLAIVGLLLSFGSEGCIRLAAWLVGISIDDEGASL